MAKKQKYEPRIAVSLVGLANGKLKKIEAVGKGTSRELTAKEKKLAAEMFKKAKFKGTPAFAVQFDSIDFHTLEGKEFPAATTSDAKKYGIKDRKFSELAESHCLVFTAVELTEIEYNTRKMLWEA